MTMEPFLLDLRPTLRQGGEPFAEIMRAVAHLAPGQDLRLLTPFEPVPLYAVLGNKGLVHTAKRIADDDWDILFTHRPGENEKPPADLRPDSGEGWPAPSLTLDHRELEAPEPMIRTLAALEAARQGEVLTVLLCRKPAFLLPEIVRRGHKWRGEFEADGESYRLSVWKTGPEGEQA